MEDNGRFTAPGKKRKIAFSTARSSKVSFSPLHDMLLLFGSAGGKYPLCSGTPGIDLYQRTCHGL